VLDLVVGPLDLAMIELDKLAHRCSRGRLPWSPADLADQLVGFFSFLAGNLEEGRRIKLGREED
jgi:hypothetical protein